MKTLKQKSKGNLKSKVIILAIFAVTALLILNMYNKSIITDAYAQNTKSINTTKKNTKTENSLNKKGEKTEKNEKNETKSTDTADSKKVKNDKGADVTTGSSLFQTVKQGGPLMIFLVLFGLVALTITIERIIFFTKNKVWKNDQLEKDLREIAKNSTAKYREDIEDELRNAFQVYTNKTEKGLALLSGIGNISPIVGFLGTVIGMIDAFASIAAATTVNAKVVAVGIQIALVTTAGGLFVAAPTLAIFYFFSHIIQNRYSFSEEMIVELCDGYPRLSGKIESENTNSEAV